MDVIIKKVSYLIILSLLLLCSCVEIEGEKIDRMNINIFKDTEVWDLALAVKSQNISKIKKLILEKPELLDFQEPKYDITLLMWSVGMEKYKSAEALLKYGANPDIVANCTKRFEEEKEILIKGELIDGNYWTITPGLMLGETALFIASGFSWIDTQAKKDPKYVKLLLEYGANPNICYIGAKPFTMPDESKYSYGSEPGTSPLMNSIWCGIEKTKALVEAGADINHKTVSGRTAARIALGAAGGSTSVEIKEYAYYLIVEKKAIVTEPYYRSGIIASNRDPDEKFYLVDLLRNWLPELYTEEYRIKMEVVDEFARQGVDYHKTEIPERILQHIQNIYPDTWEEYVKVY